MKDLIEFNKIIKITSLKETKKLVLNFSKIIKSGNNIFLIGDLGTGKTTFTKYLLNSLKVSSKILSPSFKLINEYNIILNKQNIKCYHFDLYRLENLNEIDYIGLNEYINSENNICIIEWAEKAKDFYKNIKKNITNFTIKLSYKINNKKLSLENISNPLKNLKREISITKDYIW